LAHPSPRVEPDRIVARLHQDCNEFDQAGAFDLAYRGSEQLVELVDQQDQIAANIPAVALAVVLARDVRWVLAPLITVN
jgi:hypothetical protein